MAKNLCILFDNSDTLATAHIACNLSNNAIPVHKKNVKLPLVVDSELLITVREEVACLGTGTIT